MSKKLILIRHAKSDWGNPSLKDFDRPLNKRGKVSAPEMVQRMVDRKIYPELIVSSPALRAFTTAAFFADGWNIEKAAIETDKSIYEADTKTLLQVVNGFNDSSDIIAMFGHNPGFTDFANYLGDQYIPNMPTCSIVVLEFPYNSWNLVSSGTAKVILFDYPKNGED